ncbi:DEAD/DEAH box helicase [Saccharospirillum impatiens]|uniref:DEAD/DEAH box helicase n=1 Tax=Saccharospirillum impatiens TaxID=169438 RepID=UPI000405DAEE|nr:DEAD/DEAH box helicase [Saccharospirillum impatiens]
MADPFELLSRGVQNWVYRQEWPSLRPVQAQSIPVILDGLEDIMIMAPTAGGKTEAAFLPVVSWIENSEPEGYGALTISPLKALINNQYDRLDLLCESAGTSITPWHGDVPRGIKNRSWKKPEGLLMITPESLEAMMVKRPLELKERIKNIGYVVIDEYHAFIGGVRGQQLLSLLARIEVMLNREIPRIALSATIGDPAQALVFLRPGKELPGRIVEPEGEKSELVLVVRHIEANAGKGENFGYLTALDLFRRIRGVNNLVFANSRRDVESLSDTLARLSETQGVPNEFLPHHGSLSADLRHEVEERLKEGRFPTTAIATSTLELGLDVGSVDSVAQIEAPSNVASLRQRLGRSGRRGSPSKLRIYVPGEGHEPDATVADQLELDLVQTIAVVTLMLEQWIEPPRSDLLHTSTMVQQVLSMIAYTGGVKVPMVHKVLVEKGPWRGMSNEDFLRVIRGMGKTELIGQEATGGLIIGREGERLLGTYDFYAAFKTPEEFRLQSNGRVLGQIPIDSVLMPGMLILFGGKRWEVVSIEYEPNIIELNHAAGGDPVKFGGEAAPVHSKVREMMRAIYNGYGEHWFLDDSGASALARSREVYQKRDLDQKPYIPVNGAVLLLIFADDRVRDTLAVSLAVMGLAPCAIGATLEIRCAERDLLATLVDLQELISSSAAEEIVSRLPAEPLGKFDEYLPEDIQRWGSAQARMDIPATIDYLNQLIEDLSE